MKYIAGFRDKDAAAHLEKMLRAIGDKLDQSGRVVRIMEVCGSHTMAIARYGIRDLLPPSVRLISGPGCPVCVTDGGYVDAALSLAASGMTITTFGDMLRVPGAKGTLAEARAQGARVEVCYSPLDAVDYAATHPNREVVFLAIGFETTVPGVISILKHAQKRNLRNISLLVAFKLVPPALSALAADPEVEVDGFLCPAHVSAIIGANAYRPFVEQNRIPCVVAGFEPLDILFGLTELARQLEAGESLLVNQYDRVVKPLGNLAAQALMAELLEPADASWRGIGVIPMSGLALRAHVRDFDAAVRHDIEIPSSPPDKGCRCGDVLKGKITPSECGLFNKACTPLHPVGPCMVSSEGSCAAYYKYSR
ncbi:MAG: hydrogenase formation protein HypD [Myxococcota bacterium]|jgi:hydrogenase expression/formation protein HypD|nr:hydrogenase formation protein HypD [Myxococcota bacterium]